MSPADIAVAAMFLALITCALLYQRVVRLFHVITLFHPGRIVANFRTMDAIFDTVPVHKGQTPHAFGQRPVALPTNYVYQGQTKDVAAWLDKTWTTGLLVLKDGHIACEQYYRGNDQATRTISWSLAKSCVSALVGIAVADGHIRSIEDPVTRYVDDLKNTGYHGVSIKNVLQMSSGIGFDEDYAAFFSDINRMGRAIAFNTSIDAFVRSLKNQRRPGTYNHYVSMDTQVLAMVLREATGEALRYYSERRLWQKMGMEADAYWIVDAAGMELAFGCLNATLRDYARFGQLYLQEGQWGGEQIVPAEWVRASVTPDAPHLQPGANDLSGSAMGYGYQWWIPPEPDGDFLGIGIYDQYIYVHPRHGVVIAKSSAYPDYKKDGGEQTLESVAALQSIAGQMAGA